MKRRNFLRDIALGIAATLVPKILRPMDVQECLFDENKLNERLDELRRYPHITDEWGQNPALYEKTYGSIIKFQSKEIMLKVGKRHIIT
jgi:hypothetical protein